MSTNRKAVTLFSGLGSSSKALRDLGYTVLPHDLMVEACDTLAANGFQPTLCNVKDVDFTAPRYADVEVLAGGPPCQPFSQAHKGDGRYDDRDMIPEFVRAVAEMLPALFVMEEVKTLAWAKHADYLARVEDDLRALGYRVEHRVLDASDYFIPQARKRLFVVGVREDVAQERETSRAIHASGGRTFYTTPRDAIEWPEIGETKQTLADALDWDLGDAYEAHQNTPNPTGDYGWVWERPGVTVVGSFRADVQAKPGWRKPGDGPRQNTPGSVSLTLEERLVLQDMPRDWVVRGSKAKQDLQVGNSVPCGLIRELIDINIP